MLYGDSKKIAIAIDLLKQAVKNEIPLLRISSQVNESYLLWDDRIKQILKEAFDPNSPEYTEFLWSGLFQFGRLYTDERNHYLNCLNAKDICLKKIIQKYEVKKLMAAPIKGQIDSPKHKIYPSGKTYDAYKAIMDILANAINNIMIVDSYVDDSIFHMLENARPKVQIRVLTQKMKGDFTIVSTKFKEQHEKTQRGTLEVRKSKEFHDRFIVADAKIFHLGASIKDAGSKTFILTEFAESDFKAIVLKTLSQHWDEAEILL